MCCDIVCFARAFSTSRVMLYSHLKKKYCTKLEEEDEEEENVLSHFQTASR